MNDFREQLTIDTPEQVAIHFAVAGLGSRFLAILADTALQIVAYAIVVVLIVLALSGSASISQVHNHMTPTGEKWLIAGFILFHFILFWGYFSLFEAFWRGQTPGKRWAKIRVIKDSGRQVTVFEALARNLLRIIDMLPSIYLVGAITMLCNRQHKRLGDLVAGTIVVHERGHTQPMPSSSARTFTATLYQPQYQEADRRAAIDLPADGIARLSAEDLVVIDTFFARALDLDLETRAVLATKLLQRMSEKMKLAVPFTTKAEDVLEAIVFRMREVGRFSTTR